MKEQTRNRIVIGASYGFSAVNCFSAWLVSLSSASGKYGSMLALGVVLSIMVPVSVSDPRGKMREKSAVFAAILLHILLDLFVLIFCSYWWILLLSIFETCALIIFARVY